MIATMPIRIPPLTIGVGVHLALRLSNMFHTVAKPQTRM